MQKPSLTFLIVTFVGVTLIYASVFERQAPLLIWNASASVPIGLYGVTFDYPKRGDMVLVHTPDFIAGLADKRRYLPVGIPLIKHVAAVFGDVVCASNHVVAINGIAVVRQLETDSAGRPMPLWNSCRRLERDEYFLLAEAQDSFDSRYFGPVSSAHIMGRLVPLWTK